jgi:threonine dehydrogenase-like Zn-dependent dehydrogenase
LPLRAEACRRFAAVRKRGFRLADAGVSAQSAQGFVEEIRNVRAESVACQQGTSSLCENSNPNAWLAEKMWGHSPCGIFGYSHLLGGFAGGQAEYARVPFADVGPIKVPDHLSDDQVLFLSDIFPTGYMGAEMCDIKPGQVIAVWGAGPVGQFAIASARLLGAERIVAIDRFP